MADPVARCAYHPAVDALEACARCGNYACESCLADSSTGLCRDCYARISYESFPFDRGNAPLLGLLGHTLRVFARDPFRLLAYEFGLSILALMASMAPALIASEAQQQSRLLRTAMSSLSPFLIGSLFAPLSLALYLVYVWSLLGRPFDLRSVFSAWRRWIAYAGVMAIYGVIVFPIDLAFGLGVDSIPAPPMTKIVSLFGFGLAQIGVMAVQLFVDFAILGVVTAATLELVLDPTASALGALRNVGVVLRGHWPQYLILSALMIGFMLSGLFLCFFPVFFTSLLGGLFLTAYYLALRTPASTRAA